MRSNLSMGSARNPKSEIRNPKEIRSPRAERALPDKCAFRTFLSVTRGWFSDFGFRSSFGFRGFGFRHSGSIVVLCLLALGASMFAQAQSPKPPERAAPNAVIRPQDLADALHDVLASERAVYTSLIVQRLQNEEKIIRASENWEKDKALLVPCQKLRLAAEAIQTKGAEFAYTLRSLAPIASRNKPETEIERLGLQAVARQPETNYYGNETLGGRRYLTAIYADKAISAACVSCHNEHPNSPKKDWKIGDVMGGLVIRVPLEF